MEKSGRPGAGRRPARDRQYPANRGTEGAAEQTCDFLRHIALTGAKAARGPPEEGSFEAAVQAAEAEHRGDEWIDVVDFDDVNDSESQSAAAVLASVRQ